VANDAKGTLRRRALSAGTYRRAGRIIWQGVDHVLRSMRGPTHLWRAILHQVRQGDCAEWSRVISWLGAGFGPDKQARGGACCGSGRIRWRVRRNIRGLAILWMISGILRLMGVGWMMTFGRMFIPHMRGWMGPGDGPFFGWSLDSVISHGIFSAGIVLALFGVLHLALAWGLFEREPWARMLGLVLGFLALLRFPFGTALGIYTLWVLLPETSGKEYDRLTQTGGQLNSASISS